MKNYAKLIKLNQKPTCKNIEIMINNKVKKSMIANYLKEIKGDKKFDEQALLLSTGLGRETSSWSHGFVVSENGRKLYEFGIKNILK